MLLKLTEVIIINTILLHFAINIPMITDEILGENLSFKKKERNGLKQQLLLIK